MTTPATEIQSNEQVADQQQQVEQIEVELDIGAVEQEGEVETGEPLIEAPEGQAVQYNKTGDPGLDMALSFIGKLGIGPDHPAIVAARQGDFAFIKAELAGRGDKAQGWEQYLSLAEKAFENAQRAAQESTAKTKAIVEQAVGGAEQWVAIQSWAKANAEPHEREQINYMLNQGGLAAQAAAKLLSDLYNQAHNTVVEPAEPANPNRTNRGTSNAALSPQDYQAELKALIGRIGAHRVQDSPEYAQLQQRRRMYRG
jgi:hypothetical protein